MRLFPIASDGWRFILPFGALGAFLVWLGAFWSVPLGVLGLLLALFSVFFFRDFERKTPADPLLVYSPGDGKVVDVDTQAGGEYANWKIIRIFLSVFDVHVQRSPVAGKVSAVAYTKGRFLDARDLRAHLENEQNSVTIDSEKGRVVVKQIAGLIARRIVCWTKEGHSLAQGERFGLIRFGSQVDVLLPPNVEILCKTGDRVASGLTILARWTR